MGGGIVVSSTVACDDVIAGVEVDTKPMLSGDNDGLVYGLDVTDFVPPLFDFTFNVWRLDSTGSLFTSHVYTPESDGRASRMRRTQTSPPLVVCPFGAESRN